MLRQLARTALTGQVSKFNNDLIAFLYQITECTRVKGLKVSETRNVSMTRKDCFLTWLGLA